MGRFCGKAQFPYSFEQIAQNYAQTVSTKFPHQEIRWNCCILHSAIQSVTLFLLKKSNCSHSFFQIYCVFAEEKLRQGDIISTNYHNFLGFFFFSMTPSWFWACIYWKKSVIWRHHFLLSIFSMIVSLFHGSAWSNLYVQDTVFISQHLLQPSIMTSGLWLIRKNLKSMLCSGKTLWHYFFKGSYLLLQ